MIWLITMLLSIQNRGFTQSPVTLKMDSGPNKLQKEVINRGYGMFIHFGINTFNQTEWSDGTLPVSSYNPTHLNPDQWIATAKEAGFRHIVLVTKHHDGFCLWDSQYTEYDVASSPVKTDVVKAVADACKKYGVQLGLYYSLWDRHEPTYKDKDPNKYIDFMKAQLTELLTNYGSVCELWFDGAWDRKIENWDIPGVYSHIKNLQPGCAVTVNHTIGVGTEGVNKIGQPKNFRQGDIIRFWPVDFRTKDPNLVRSDDPKLYNYEGQLHYLPFEHTICISDRWNWFQKKDMLPARPVDELEELFYWCTANDNILIINIPPDQTGQLRKHEVNRILQLADRLGIRSGKGKLPSGNVNLSFGQKTTASTFMPDNPPSLATDMSLETTWKATADTSSICIDFGKSINFNRIALFEFFEEEELGDGFSIIHTFATEEFSIDIFDGITWVTVHMGEQIGACKIINLPAMESAQKIRINILKAIRPTGFYHISVSDSRTKSIRTSIYN